MVIAIDLGTIGVRDHSSLTALAGIFQGAKLAIGKGKGAAVSDHFVDGAEKTSRAGTRGDLALDLTSQVLDLLSEAADFIANVIAIRHV